MTSARDLILPHLNDCEAAVYGAKVSVKPIAKLNINEFQFDLSPKVVNAIKEQAEAGKFYVYLGDEPTAELQQKVADYVGVDFENIVLDEALDQAFNRLPRVFAGPGDNIVTMSPTYPELALGVQRVGGKIKKVALQEPDFQMNPDNVINAIDGKTKFVFVCNPNNPTSLKAPRDDILKVVENAKNSIVVVDECYYEYCQETLADVVNDYENLFVARSFSKGFGLAGTRMAYLIASKGACEAYSRILNGFEFNRFGVYGAIASLDNVSHYQKVWDIVADEKVQDKKGVRKSWHQSMAVFNLIHLHGYFIQRKNVNRD